MQDPKIAIQCTCVGHFGWLESKLHCWVIKEYLLKVSILGWLFRPHWQHFSCITICLYIQSWHYVRVYTLIFIKDHNQRDFLNRFFLFKFQPCLFPCMHSEDLSVNLQKQCLTDSKSTAWKYAYLWKRFECISVRYICVRIWGKSLCIYELCLEVMNLIL